MTYYLLVGGLKVSLIKQLDPQAFHKTTAANFIPCSVVLDLSESLSLVPWSAALNSGLRVFAASVKG